MNESPIAAHAAAPDFTLAGYRELLAETIQILPARGFETLRQPDFKDQRFCLIRHDIDMSPRGALEMARIEAELGVRATYAVLMTGEFYNPFEREVRDQLLELAGLGHDIALHFDAAWHKISDAQSLHAAVEWDARVLSRLLDGLPISTFSFHNTTPFTMGCREIEYGGLLNMYCAALQEDVLYVSDSNGYWRMGTWREALARQTGRLQVLTHPEWWTDYEAQPAEKVCRVLDARTRRAWDDYVNLLAVNNRENRSAVPGAFSALSLGVDWERSILREWLTGSLTQAHAELVRRTALESGVARDRGREGDLSDDELAVAFEALAQAWAHRRERK